MASEVKGGHWLNSFLNLWMQFPSGFRRLRAWPVQCTMSWSSFSSKASFIDFRRAPRGGHKIFTLQVSWECISTVPCLSCPFTKATFIIQGSTIEVENAFQTALICLTFSRFSTIVELYSNPPNKHTAVWLPNFEKKTLIDVLRLFLASENYFDWLTWLLVLLHT